MNTATTAADAVTQCLAELAGFPDRVAALLTGIPASALCIKPNSEAFSLLEHLCHLRDLDAEAYCVRVRRIVEEEVPTLAEVNGSKWAEERNYQSQDPDQAMRDWRRNRQMLVDLLRQHLPRHAERRGTFMSFGIVTLQGLTENVGRHDAEHWGEIAELAAAVTPQR